MVFIIKHRHKVIILLSYILVLHFLSIFLGYSLGKTSRYSIFYNQRVQDQDFERYERISNNASLMYLKSKKTKDPHWPLNSSVSDPGLFCITIITQKRPRVEYITRTTAYLLSRLEVLEYLNGDPFRIKVYITNSERPKEDHKTLLTLGTAVDIIHLEDHVERIRSLNKTESNIPFVSNSKLLEKTSLHLWFRNEVLDTALLLDYAEEIGCQNLMVLEDDGIVSRDFYTKIQEALEILKSREYFSLKLYNSNAFEGWSKSHEDVSLLLRSTGIVAIFFAGIPHFFEVSGFSQFRRFGRLQSILLGMHLWIFYVCLFLAIGKQSLFPKYKGKGVVKLEDYQSSTVGVVYSMKHIRGLSSFLGEKVMMMDVTSTVDWNEKGLKPVDLLIRDFANLDNYVLLPNVVQHIGRFSSTNAKNQGNIRRLIVSDSFPETDVIF